MVSYKQEKEKLKLLSINAVDKRTFFERRRTIKRKLKKKVKENTLRLREISLLLTIFSCPAEKQSVN